MAENYIAVSIEEKRAYAYIIMENYGWVNDGDPWDIVPNSNGEKSVTIYRFSKCHLPHFVETVKAYLTKHGHYIKWESAAQAIGEHLSGLIMPWRELEYLFWISKFEAKRVYSKCIDFHEEYVHLNNGVRFHLHRP